MRALSLDQLKETGSLAESVLASMVTGDAQMDRIALWLDTVLDQTFALLRNVDLPHGHTPIDFLVAGPTGIWAIFVETDAGQFKSLDGAFFAWETQAGGYVQIDPDPLLILKSTLAQIRTWLKSHRLPPLCAHTAILFTDPAAVVDSSDDDVQLVGPQVVEAYPVQIAQAEVMLDAAAVDRFVMAVAKGKLPPPPPLERLRHRDSTESNRWRGLERWQWAVLGLLAFLDVVVLGAFLAWAVYFNR